MQHIQATSTHYISLEGAFAQLNDKLFDHKLPDVLITMQRRGGKGFFSARSLIHR